jgi:uncharacterized protein
MDNAILIGGAGSGPQYLNLKRANRHGIIAGATGTGKTVTLQGLAEGFAKAGVPVFAADVKGDFSGISMPGNPPPGWVTARAAELGMEHAPWAPHVVFWDLFGEQGHPVRTTISEMGPTLLSRILDLSDAQEGALTVAFKLADEDGLLLLDLKDLRSLLNWIAENGNEVGSRFGLVSPQTCQAIQRKLLQLEMDGADKFFAEPALELADIMKTASDGTGIVNVLAADKLIRSPKLYATFLLWLLSELFEQLPEAGDLDKPKLVFFFDEAHLLFTDAPQELLSKIEQVARLIRSKGVGIYFVTQSPADIPDIVLSQLGNRVQHALRAYTPADQKAVKAAAQSFRAPDGMDVVQEIQNLGVGVALVSTLDEKGVPSPVAVTKIRAPFARVGPATPAERDAIQAQSPVSGKYDREVDRHSAFEILSGRAETAAKDAQEAEEAAERAKAQAAHQKEMEKQEKERQRAESRPEPRRSSKPTPVERAASRVATQATRSIFSTITREVVRGIFGTMKRR